MVWLELCVVLAFIYLGARLGSIGIGFAGAAGVIVLTLGFGLSPGAIPMDVILIIMSVIGAVAAMQVAGGLDYLVQLADGILRQQPKKVTFLAPLITYFMTVLAGTGHTAYSTLPVIAAVARENGVRPSRPLSISVIASQVAITASPVSAAIVVFSGLLEPLGVGYLDVLMICIPTTLVAVMVTAVVCNYFGCELKDDVVYQQRLADGVIKSHDQLDKTLPPGAKRSVLIFLLGIIAVVVYATLISDKVGIITNPVLPRDGAIISIMLTVACVITLATGLHTGDILNAQTFKSGMSACICVLGVRLVREYVCRQLH